MNRIKIKLESPEHLYDGSMVIDAKSVIGVFGIQMGKEIEVEMLGADKDEIKEFMKRIREYEVVK